MNEGKIDVSEITNVTTGSAPLKTCDAPVSAFNLTVHALGMCETDPTDFITGNTNSDPCFYMWNTDTGDTAISFGVTTSSEHLFQQHCLQQEYTLMGLQRFQQQYP